MQKYASLHSLPGIEALAALLTPVSLDNRISCSGTHLVEARCDAGVPVHVHSQLHTRVEFSAPP
jgi:hypothetical protein